GHGAQDRAGAGQELRGRGQAGKPARRTAVPPGAADGAERGERGHASTRAVPDPVRVRGRHAAGGRITSALVLGQHQGEGAGARREPDRRAGPQRQQARRGDGRAGKGQPPRPAVGHPRPGPGGHPRPDARPGPPRSPPAPAPTAASPNGTSTWQQASGNAAALSPQIKNLFDKVNCAKKDWAQQIGYSPAVWDNPKNQIVACGRSNGTSGVPFKFVLDQAKV